MKGRRKLGGRGRFLLSVGVLFILLGIGYAGTVSPAVHATLAFHTRVLPLRVWGVLFLLAGVAGVVGGFWRRAQTFSFVTLQLLCSAWGLGHVGGWLVDDLPRAWVSAGIFLTFTNAILAVADCRDEP